MKVEKKNGNILNIGFMRLLKFSDETLPDGRTRKLEQRKNGKTAGRWDVYIISPWGDKFASRKK